MLAPIGLTRCFFILSKKAFSLTVNSGNLDRWNNFQTVFPKMGPMSQPKKVAAKVRMPMLMTGSIGINFVTSSAISGCVERKTNATPVTAMDETIELARE